MADIKGLNKLARRINKLIDKAKAGTKDGTARVTVGYTEYYAIFVHWNMAALHPNGKALFLLDPYRVLKPKAAGIIKRLMKKGMNIHEALLELGEQLKTASQKEVPRKTGALHDSAYVL